MSLLIKGMKMPKNCTICRFCVPEADPEHGEMCMATGKYMPPCSTDWLDDCPLVEVPPHERLVDCEALKDYIAVLLELNNKLIDKWLAHAVEDVLDEAPTIIEAEGGEEA